MTQPRPSEWFDDESFWRETFPFVFSEKLLEIGAETAEKALQLARPAGRAVLDLCCGPGRCAVALASRGFAVTGVDRTKYLLDKARRSAKAAHAEVEWVRSDMRDFVRPNAFDLALSIFTSFGYFENREDDLQVLRNVYASLKPGGVFFMDVMSKERLARIYSPTISQTLPNGATLVEIHRILDDWTRIENQWIVIKNGAATWFKFHINVYSGLELRDRLERAGFSDVKLFGSFEGGPYDVSADRLIAVARRAGKIAAEHAEAQRI